MHFSLSSPQLVRVLVLLTSVFHIAAGAAPAGVLDEEIAVDIAAQGVAPALLQLSKQTNVLVLMPGGNLDSFRCPALLGRMTLRRALDHLLHGKLAGQSSLSVWARLSRRAALNGTTRGSDRCKLDSRRHAVSAAWRCW